MSYMLASLEDTKHWLNVSHDGDDSKIEFGIIAASSMVMAYLKASPEDYAGSDLEADSDGVLIGILPQMTGQTFQSEFIPAMQSAARQVIEATVSEDRARAALGVPPAEPPAPDAPAPE